MAANEPGQPTPLTFPPTPTTNLPTPATALAVGAHPDDVEFGAGGTLAKWAANGCVVHHVVCTDGSKGTWDPGADVARLVRGREDEQREAARRLAGTAAGEVRFLRLVDGELANDPATRLEIVRAVRELRPDVVLGHDPWKRYRLHPDHRHAGLLVCDAVVAARDAHFHPELGLEPHRPTDLLLWEADVVSHVEDVSTSIDTKLDALEAHVSQFESTMHATSADELSAFRERVRRRLGDLGRPYGMETAELFARVDDL